MVVEVGEHPLVLLGELEICLPKLVASQTLESPPTPRFSGPGDGVVEPGLNQNLVYGCVAQRGGVIVAEVSFYAAWSPVSNSSELKDEFSCSLRSSMYSTGPVRFDR